jgi:hypothetical protein
LIEGRQDGDDAQRIACLNGALPEAASFNIIPGLIMAN